jgi:multiple antibiotic resistance protein
METMTFFSAAILLLLIIDPFGNLVLINSLLRELPERERQKLILRECLIAFAILVFFLFTGDTILATLGLRPATLSISGGIVLFLIALGMVFPSRGSHIGEVGEKPFIVPIAVPLIAGPSALAMLLLMATREPGSLGKWLGALAAALGVSTLVLWLSPLFYEKLGRAATSAIERLVGMLLIMVSVQMFLDGVGEYL